MTPHIPQLPYVCFPRRSTEQVGTRRRFRFSSALAGSFLYSRSYDNAASVATNRTAGAKIGAVAAIKTSVVVAKHPPRKRTRPTSPLQPTVVDVEKATAKASAASGAAISRQQERFDSIMEKVLSHTNSSSPKHDDRIEQRVRNHDELESPSGHTTKRNATSDQYRRIDTRKEPVEESTKEDRPKSNNNFSDCDDAGPGPGGDGSNDETQYSESGSSGNTSGESYTSSSYSGSEDNSEDDDGNGSDDTFFMPAVSLFRMPIFSCGILTVGIHVAFDFVETTHTA